MDGPSTPFFNPGSELAVLEGHIRRLRVSAHSPSVTRAEHILVGIQRATFEKHEAQLQISIARSKGFDEHRELWEGKLDAIEKSANDSAAALHRLVDELRSERFRRYWCAQRLQRAVLEFLYVASDGGVPRISRSYLREAAFIVPPTVR